MVAFSFLFVALSLSCTQAFAREAPLCQGYRKALCPGQPKAPGGVKETQFFQSIEKSYIHKHPDFCKAHPGEAVCRNVVGSVSDQAKSLSEVMSQRHDPASLQWLSPPVQEFYDQIARDEAAKLNARSQPEIRRIKTIFSKAKERMIEKINLEIPDPLRARLVQRLQKVEISEKTCLEPKVPTTALLGEMALYYPVPHHTVMICSQLLTRRQTDAALSFYLAHELAHSIDPCNLAKGAGDILHNLPPVMKYERFKPDSFDLSTHPYGDVLKCLREPDSGGAKVIPSQNKPDNPDPAFENLCAHDQINETFCDWMGTEVAAPMVSGLLQRESLAESNREQMGVLAFSCGETDDDDDVHLPPAVRFDRIYLMHPTVRKSLNCSAPPKGQKYCKPPLKAAKPIKSSSGGRK